MKNKTEGKLITVIQCIELLAENQISATKPTVINWIKKYNLGKQVGGRWFLYEDKVLDFISDEEKR